MKYKEGDIVIFQQTWDIEPIEAKIVYVDKDPCELCYLIIIEKGSPHSREFYTLDKNDITSKKVFDTYVKPYLDTHVFRWCIEQNLTLPSPRSLTELVSVLNEELK